MKCHMAVFTGFLTGSVWITSCLVNNPDHSSAKIIGGEIVTDGTRTIAITNDKNRFECGAVYIGDGWSLTSAFCVVNGVPPHQITWATDREDIATNKTPIKLVFTTADGDKATPYHDLALVYTETRLEDKGVQPVDLPSRPASVEGGEQLIMYGRGKITNVGSIGNEDLEKVELQMASQEQCQTVFASLLRDDAASNRILCSGGDEGTYFKGGAYGDDGYGVIRAAKDNQKAELVGIGTFFPDPSFPGYSFFTDVYPYLPWIYSTTAGFKNDTIDPEDLAVASCRPVFADIGVLLELQDDTPDARFTFLTSLDLGKRQKIAALPSSVLPLVSPCFTVTMGSSAVKTEFFVDNPRFENIYMKITRGSKNQLFWLGKTFPGDFLLTEGDRSFYVSLSLEYTGQTRPEKVPKTKEYQGILVSYYATFASEEPLPIDRPYEIGKTYVAVRIYEEEKGATYTGYSKIDTDQTGMADTMTDASEQFRFPLDSQLEFRFDEASKKADVNLVIDGKQFFAGIVDSYVYKRKPFPPGDLFGRKPYDPISLTVSKAETEKVDMVLKVHKTQDDQSKYREFLITWILTCSEPFNMFMKDQTYGSQRPNTFNNSLTGTPWGGELAFSNYVMIRANEVPEGYILGGESVSFTLIPQQEGALFSNELKCSVNNYVGVMPFGER